MRPALFFPPLVLCLTAIPQTGIAQESWVGKTVLLKAPPSKLCPPKTNEQPVLTDQIDFDVSSEKDGHIQVKTDEGILLWFEKKDAVLRKDAISYFTDQIKMHPQSAWAYLGRAAAMDISKELDSFLPDLDEAIRLDPKLADACILRGWVWLWKKQFDKSMVDFESALKLRPLSFNAHRGCGYALMFSKDYDKALVHFNEAVRLAPTDPRCYLDRAMLLTGQEKYAKAIADFDKAIKLDPKNAQAFLGRGNLLMISGHPDKALADFQKADALKSPTKAPLWQAHLLQGVVLTQKKEFDGALAEFDEAIKQEPKNADLYLMRAEAWKGKKKYDRVSADLHEAVRLQPTMEVNFSSLAWLLAGCPDAKYRDGARALQLAKKMNPKDTPETAELMAAAYAETGDFQQAISWQEKALQSRFLDDADSARRRLQLYKEKKAYRFD